jgi:S-adenosylmethionine-diacylglycerol 3-amino-3-carboxypropyl transferase
VRKRPLYSACNEDTRSEIRALEPRRGDTVVSIAAGGGRALSLLSTDATRVIAVDCRLDQVFNTELKAAAIECLPYRAFREFIGLDRHPGRRDVYTAIRPSLGLRCRGYWDARLDLIEEGVLYAGRLERALWGFCRALRHAGLFRWPDTLMRSQSIEEQHRLLREQLRGVKTGSLYWAVFCNPLTAWIAMQDPSFLRCTEGMLGSYLFRRLFDYAGRQLVGESCFLQLIYYGRYSNDGPLPVYLSPQSYEQVRKNIGRLDIRHCRIEDALSHVGRHGSTKWSLSDISCWMTEKHFHTFLRELALQLHTGDRVCYRNFGVVYRLPRDVEGKLVRLDELCEHVETLDTSVFFRIEIAQAS